MTVAPSSKMPAAPSVTAWNWLPRCVPLRRSARRWTIPYARYRFARFTDLQGNEQSGNRLPGLPRQTLFAENAREGRHGLFLAADTLAVGKLFADNANGTAVAGNALVNLRGSLALSTRGAPELFFALSNLLDRDTFANIRINANGNRYFEPAPGRAFFAGIALHF